MWYTHTWVIICFAFSHGVYFAKPWGGKVCESSPPPRSCVLVPRRRHTQPTQECLYSMFVPSFDEQLGCLHFFQFGLHGNHGLLLCFLRSESRWCWPAVCFECFTCFTCPLLSLQVSCIGSAAFCEWSARGRMHPVGGTEERHSERGGLWEQHHSHAEFHCLH